MMSVSQRPLHRARSLRKQVGSRLPGSFFTTALSPALLTLPSWKASESRGPRPILFWLVSSAKAPALSQRHRDKGDAASERTSSSLLRGRCGWREHKALSIQEIRVQIPFHWLGMHPSPRH